VTVPMAAIVAKCERNKTPTPCFSSVVRSRRVEVDHRDACSWSKGALSLSASVYRGVAHQRVARTHPGVDRGPPRDVLVRVFGQRCLAAAPGPSSPNIASATSERCAIIGGPSLVEGHLSARAPLTGIVDILDADRRLRLVGV
jgi:hypothetical protein